MKKRNAMLVLLAALCLAGCAAAELTPTPTPVPVATAAPEPTDDDWLKIAREAMYDEDYEAALAALEELAVKSDEAENLRARIHFEQGEAALDAGDFAAAIEFYRAAEKEDKAAGRLKFAEAMLRGDYLEAARTASEITARRHRPWQSFISSHMGEPKTLEDFLRNTEISNILSHRDKYYLPVNEQWIESIDREETQVVNVGYVGSIVPQDQRDRLLILSEGAPELELCGQGGGKALIVRRQQDYPRGSVYAKVDERMELIPPGLGAASLDEVDYIIYLDYDYSVCASVTAPDGRMLSALQVYCVVHLVNENTGEELYRSEKIMGDTDYNNPYRLEYLVEKDWVACGNPPIGRALAEAISALPEKE